MTFKYLNSLGFILVLMLVATPVMAADDHSSDVPIDLYIKNYCDIAYTTSSQIICSQFRSLFESTNKLTATEIEQIIDGADTVQDTEYLLLSLQEQNSVDRINGHWNNIASMMFIVTDALEIFFWLFMLAVLFHIPFLYIRLLVLIKDASLKRFGRSKK